VKPVIIREMRMRRRCPIISTILGLHSNGCKPNLEPFSNT